MGSWKTTCSVSATPISSGHPVRLFFIASDRMKYRASSERSSISKGSISYSYNDFKVIGSVGLKAYYRDCGKYLFDENSIEAQHILSEIKGSYIKNPTDLHNEGFDEKSINISTEDLNFKKIQFMIEEGDLYLKSFTPGVLNFVSIMAVHESVYQMMINEETSSYDISISDYKTKGLSDVIQEGLQEYKKWKIQIEEEKMNFVDIFLNKANTEEEKKLAYDKARKLSMTTLRFGQDYERHYVFKGKDSLISFLDVYHEFENETEEGIVSKILEARLFFNKMEEHNIMIRPTMTSCEIKNIEDSIDFYKKLIVTLQQVADTQFESIDGEEDEDD